MRSQPRLGQRGESLGVHKKNWKGPAAQNEGQREDHSKQRDPTSRKPFFCMVVVRARGTRKSPLDAERRDRRPEQAEVRIKSLMMMSMTVCVVVLRDQMFNRQLKEVLQIGDKELLRAVIVRYEDSKPPSDRQKNDVADEKDDGFQESKELLKTIDYYYHNKIPYHHRICYQNSSGGSTQGLETG